MDTDTILFLLFFIGVGLTVVYRLGKLCKRILIVVAAAWVGYRIARFLERK